MQEREWPRFCPRCGALFRKEVYVGESRDLNERGEFNHFYGPQYECDTVYWPKMKLAQYSPKQCEDVVNASR